LVLKESGAQEVIHLANEPEEFIGRTKEYYIATGGNCKEPQFIRVEPII
jgi:hypothetical protein